MKSLFACLLTLCFAVACFGQDFTNLANEPTSVITQVHPFQGSVDCFFNHYAFVNSDSTIDEVFNQGINVAPGGGQVVSTQAAAYWQFESNYLMASGVRVSEAHLDMTPPNQPSLSVRPLHFEQNHSTGNITGIIRAGNLNFVDGSGTVKLQIANGYAIFDNGTIIRSTANDANFIQQYNHANTSSYTLLKLNSADVVELGQMVLPVAAAQATFGTLKIKDSGATLTVTIGDASSCGTGYRCLRVPN